MSKQDDAKAAKAKEAEAKKAAAEKAKAEAEKAAAAAAEAKRKEAEKAAKEAEKAAAKAKAEAEKQAKKAAAEAERVQKKAEAEKAKAEVKAAKEKERAEKAAAKAAEREARKNQPRPPKPWADLQPGHEQQAPREGCVLHKTLEFMAKNKGATLAEIQELVGPKHNARRLLTWANRERGYGFVMIKERITPLAPNLRVQAPKAAPQATAN